MKSLTLSDGETLEVERVLSSAGYVETLNLCEQQKQEAERHEVGRMSFMESLFALDCEPKDIGYDKSIVFFSTRDSFTYRVPDTLIDETSGVLCAPNNFQYPEPLKEGMLRLTNQANFALWDAMARSDYRAAKKAEKERALQELRQFFPDFMDHVTYMDAFTPKTIHKYTGHLNGAVYGSPERLKMAGLPSKTSLFAGQIRVFWVLLGRR